MTVSPTPAEAEKVVAEMRAAMEGTDEGPLEVIEYGDGDSLVIHSGDDWRICFMATPGSSPGAMELIEKNAAWIARCSPSGISALLALIESQRATIESVERERDRLVVERDGSGRAYVEQMLAREAAEARVTALEAEKSGLVKALEKAAGALNVVVSNRFVRGGDAIAFTGDWWRLGKATYAQILDEADAALSTGEKPNV